MGDDKIQQFINYLKQMARNAESDSDVMRRERLGSEAKMSGMSDQEVPDYIAENMDDSRQLSPDSFMGMGSTRAVRELGPTLGKMVNKIGGASRTPDTNRFSKLLPHFNDEMRYAKFVKQDNADLPPGMLENLKYSQKQLGSNYETLKNSRNYNNKTDYDRLLEKGIDIEGYAGKDYTNLEKNIIAEQDVIGEAGYKKLRELLNNIRKATGE
jgi:hypothetical protein